MRDNSSFMYTNEELDYDFDAFFYNGRDKKKQKAGSYV